MYSSSNFIAPYLLTSKTVRILYPNGKVSFTIMVCNYQKSSVSGSTLNIVLEDSVKEYKLQFSTPGEAMVALVTLKQAIDLLKPNCGTVGGGGGNPVRFGIEDIVGVQNRLMDMNNHNFTITGASNMEFETVVSGNISSLKLNNSVVELTADDGTISTVLNIQPGSATMQLGANTQVFPNGSGYYTLSVNGIAADDSGNITLEVGTALNGTGFVVVNGTDITYDNSTYITQADGDLLYYPLNTNPSSYITIADIVIPSLQDVTNVDSSTDISIFLNSGAGLVVESGDVVTPSLKISNALISGSITGENLTDDRFFNLPDFGDGTPKYVLAISVNGEFADSEGNINLSSSNPTLDSVTNTGNTTTNSITTGDILSHGNISTEGVFNFLLFGDLSFTSFGSTTSNIISITKSGIDYWEWLADGTIFRGNIPQFDLSILSWELNATNITRDVKCYIPDGTGTLVISVNGEFADSEGNINISSQDLQSVLSIDNTASIEINLTDGAGINVSGPIKTNTGLFFEVSDDLGSFHEWYSNDGHPALKNGSSDPLPLFEVNGLGAGIFGTLQTAGNYIWALDASDLSSNSNLRFPSASGRIPLSVNGQTANSAGAITISVGTVTSVSGTTNRITVATGTTTPVIDISSSYIGQASITTLGTITTGTWNGTAISDTYISSAATWNAKQNQLNGTGFVKASGTTISYDNSTYLTANQSITLSSEASGTGTTTIAVTLSNSAVIGKVLTGFTLPSIASIVATDTILQAFGKTQIQINSNTTAIAGKQAQLNGTGFVKASGTTISYDNTVYYPNTNPNGYITVSSLTPKATSDEIDDLVSTSYVSPEDLGASFYALSSVLFNYLNVN